MKSKVVMLLLLLTIAANTHAKIGDIISPEVLRVGINGEMPSDCTEWLYYTWEGILRCEVTSESPKECQLMGDFLADTGEYVQAISDPNGRLAANEACHIIVPQYVKGYRVVGVGHFSLYKNDFVTSLHLPEGVRSVVNAAVYENKKLAYVSLPSTIETLGATAFTGNDKLKEVYIHSITPPTVGDRTFDGNDATLHVLYASSYKKEPWTNWFGTDGIVYPDLTIGDVMADPYEQHMELEQRLAVAYPQMKEAFNNGTAYAWFDGKKNELTLRNMTLNCGAIGEEVRPISTAHDINVNLEGDNHFTGRVTTGMYFGGVTTLNITGTTRIDMEGDCYSLDGIVSNGDGLYLKGGGELIIDVDDEGIRSENILSIDNTRLTLRSQERSGITGGTLRLSGKKTVVSIDSYRDCISSVSDLELEDGLTIVKPEGAQFYHNAVRDQNGVVLSGQLEISVPKIEFPLVVCGVVVNNVNEDDLLAEMPTTEGYIVNKTDDSALYYDNETQTLTMRNVQVTLPDGVEVIHNGLNDSFVENLKVNIEGECLFNGSAGIFERDGGILFTGNGTLMVNAGEGCGLRVFTRAEVDGPTVVLNSTDSGVFADNSTEDASLAVTSGTLKVTGGIVCFRLELAEEMDILSPNCAHFGLSDNGVHYGVVNEDDALVMGEIVIGERNSYYVFVGGVELTKEFCQNPDALIEVLAEKDEQLMEDFFDGTVEIYYIPETKTLHLKNFRINLTDADGITNGGLIRGANRHGVLGLNIEVEGDCSITTVGTVPLYDFNGSITLTGGGTLTLRSDNNIGMCCYDDFTLDGPTVVSEGTIGFYCSEPYKETTANILSGTLKVKGSDKCILAEQLNLGEGIFITKPDGAQWSDRYYSVVDADGNIVKNEWVVIGTAIATGISDEGILVKTEGLNAQMVYDLQGRLISTQHPSSITPGIYIVNSRKVIVR